MFLQHGLDIIHGEFFTWVGICIVFSLPTHCRIGFRKYPTVVWPLDDDDFSRTLRLSRSRLLVEGGLNISSWGIIYSFGLNAQLGSMWNNRWPSGIRDSKARIEDSQEKGKLGQAFARTKLVLVRDRTKAGPGDATWHTESFQFICLVKAPPLYIFTADSFQHDFIGLI